MAWMERWTADAGFAPRRCTRWILAASNVTYQSSPLSSWEHVAKLQMQERLATGLAEQQLCVLHFTLSLESGCAEMRRENGAGHTGHERQREIMRFITENGENWPRVPPADLHLTMI